MPWRLRAVERIRGRDNDVPPFLTVIVFPDVVLDELELLELELDEDDELLEDEPPNQPAFEAKLFKSQPFDSLL